MAGTAARPLVTRRDARRESRREAILDVAAQSFLDRGYAGTTMSAVAAALGGSKGTLWSYFPNKEELFAAVLDRATEQFQRELAPILNPRDPPETALRELCRHFIRTTTHPEAIALHRLVVGESKRFPEVGRIFHARGPGVMQHFLGAYLDAAVEQGLLCIEDTATAVDQLIGLCLSGSHAQLVLGMIEEPDEAAIEYEAANCLRSFLHAFAP